MLKFQLENQGDMIDNLRKNNEEVRVLRHDLKHHAVIVRDMIMDGNTDGAIANLGNYIEEIICAQQKTDYIKDNPSINAVIYNCMCKCNDKGITCNIKVTTNYEKHMDQDVAIMFANLIDNAIRAEEAEENDKRVINISIFENAGIIRAVISNYIKSSVLDNNPELRTSKEDEKVHGWGMKSVKNIIEKYQGGVDICEENNFFSVTIRISRVLNK